ncbi:MAG: SIS domain-containing protein [Thermoprotei archaeon]
MAVGKNTLLDISEIPAAITNIINNRNLFKEIGSRISSYEFNKVFLIGCGSSFYIGVVVSYLLKRLLQNKCIKALPSSELLLYEHVNLDERSLVIGFSRSGNTAETVSALELAKSKGSKTVLLSINKESKGSRIVDEYVYVDVGVERGIVMTKSFVSLTLAGLLLSDSISGPSEAIGSQALSKFSSFVNKVIDDKEHYLNLGKELALSSYERFVFLGSGPSYGIALEASLKFKETSYIATEAIHALEFRHGPMATVNEKQVEFIINPTGESFEVVYRLYKDIVNIGGKVIRLSDERKPDILLANTGVEELNALEAIVPLQYIAMGYALAKGKDPDNPRNLTRVVEKF